MDSGSVERSCELVPAAVRIIDAFLFSGELDMLELRLRELDPIVDRFVICEADTTFQGRPRKVLLPEHKDRFAPWWDRITHLVVDDLPAGEDCWQREHFQRDAIKRGLNGLRATDLFMLSDVDEIPTVQQIRKVRPNPVCVFEMAMHSFAVDWLYPTPWNGTVACYGRDIKDISILRYARDKPDFNRVKGGRHFTWLGDTTATNKKLRSFSHADLVGVISAYGLERYYSEGFHVDGTKLLPVDVDETWPEWIYKRECPEAWFRPR